MLALIVLVLCILLGFALVLFGLPGTYVIVIGALLYNLIAWSVEISWGTTAVLLVLALIGELFDVIASGIAVKKYGSSFTGMIGAVIGGIVGSIVGVPIPVIGSVIGLFLGGFIGAFVFELIRYRNMKKAWNAGVGSFVGRITSIFIKIVLALIMVLIIMAAVWY